MNYTITIGICVKDCEVLIEDTINSIINQKFPHNQMEIIFVDDGSKDKTLPIINSKILSINIDAKVYHHKWKGLGASRNVVVNNAKGNYIVWIDCGMIMSSDYIEKLVDFMDENPKVGIAQGKHTLSLGPNWASTLEIYARRTGNLRADFSNTSKSMGTGGAIYRVEAIRQVKGFDDEIKGYGEDWDIENRIRKRGWLFGVIDVYCSETERIGITWNDLWRRYFKQGYDMRYFLARPKNRELLSIYRYIPPAAFISGLIHAFYIYKLTRNRLAFLLPFQYMFKMIAWCYGYYRGLQ